MVTEVVTFTLLMRHHYNYGTLGELHPQVKATVIFMPDKFHFPLPLPFSHHDNKAKLFLSAILMPAAMIFIIITATFMPFMPPFSPPQQPFSMGLLPFSISLISLFVLWVKSSIFRTFFLFLLVFIIFLHPQVSPYLLVWIPLFTYPSQFFCSIFITRCHRISSFLLAVISLFSPPVCFYVFSLSIHPELLKRMENRLWCGFSSHGPWSVYVRLCM